MCCIIYYYLFTFNDKYEIRIEYRMKYFLYYIIYYIFILNSEHIFSGKDGWILALLVKLIVF